MSFPSLDRNTGTDEIQAVTNCAKLWHYPCHRRRKSLTINDSFEAFVRENCRHGNSAHCLEQRQQFRTLEEILILYQIFCTLLILYKEGKKIEFVSKDNKKKLVYRLISGKTEHTKYLMWICMSVCLYACLRTNSCDYHNVIMVITRICCYMKESCVSYTTYNSRAAKWI